MTPNDCPCGTGRTFAACCEPYLLKKSAPPTAEALMRARYSAYATGRIDFVAATHDPENQSDFNRESAEKWARESQWKGLSIVSTQQGGPSDTAGVVSFIARYSAGGQDHEHRETAMFKKREGVWFFSDGKGLKPDTYVKTGPDLGRNDPCHCGSKKKFKKCHGK